MQKKQQKHMNKNTRHTQVLIHKYINLKQIQKGGRKATTQKLMYFSLVVVFI